MRIVVDPHVPGNPNLRCRMTRRFAYIAWIAHDLGHDVAVRCEPNEFKSLRNMETYGGRSGFSFVNLLNDIPTVSDLRNADLLVCSEEMAVRQRRPDCKVAAWRTRLGGGAEVAAKRRKFDVLCGYVFSEPDWTKKVTTKGLPRGDTPPENKLGDKWLSVPWIPFEPTLHAIHQDGLWKAYLQDDLGAIRDKYGATEKRRHAGFIGYPWGWRTKIARSLDDPRFVFLWPTHVEHKATMGPREYLLWLSECRLSLCLPGDTWKCSRFGESVMMGVPTVNPRGRMWLTPPLADYNAVLVDEWSELLEMDLSDQRLRNIAACADEAYREGWSLRGQVKQMLRRLGLADA